MICAFGFAVAIHVDPDVLLVDEVLAVGDEGFTHKCLDKFSEFKRRGKTILLVTHSLGLVERFCDEALWVDGGKVRGEGDPRRVVGAYLTDVEKSEEQQLAADEVRRSGGSVRRSGRQADGPAENEQPALIEEPADMHRAVEGRWGSREIEIIEVFSQEMPMARCRTSFSRESEWRYSSRSGQCRHERFRVRDRPLQCGRCHLLWHQHRDRGISAGRHPRRRVGHLTFDSLDPGVPTSSTSPSTIAPSPLRLSPGSHTFRVKSRTGEVGIYRPRHAWTFSPTVRLTKS